VGAGAMPFRLVSLLPRIFRPRPPTLLCTICNNPVPIETSRTDEYGQPVHEHCYLEKLRWKRIRDGYA
jgi:hypothetical protein